MSAYLFGAIVPIVVTILFRNSKNVKKRGVPADVGGEPGFAIRNHRFTSPVSTAWEGVTTLAELFEYGCVQYRDRFLLGTRKLISRDVEISQDGRSFEKLHLGDYEWLTYGKAFQVVCNFASGLANIGHLKGERAAIFADTREEWFIALQVFFLCIHEFLLDAAIFLCHNVKMYLIFSTFFLSGLLQAQYHSCDYLCIIGR